MAGHINGNKHTICKEQGKRFNPYFDFYGEGYGKCLKCEVFFKDVLRCPCCNQQLRKRRRDKTGTGKNSPNNDTRARH